jgi:hypothetical protein
MDFSWNQDFCKSLDLLLHWTSDDSFVYLVETILLKSLNWVKNSIRNVVWGQARHILLSSRNTLSDEDST